MTTPLSEHKISDYARDGFVAIRNAVPSELLQRMQSVTAQLIDESRGTTDNNDVFDLDVGHSAA